MTHRLVATWRRHPGHRELWRHHPRAGRGMPEKSGVPSSKRERGILVVILGIASCGGITLDRLRLRSAREEWSGHRRKRARNPGDALARVSRELHSFPTQSAEAAQGRDGDEGRYGVPARVGLSSVVYVPILLEELPMCHRECGRQRGTGGVAWGRGEDPGRRGKRPPVSRST